MKHRLGSVMALAALIFALPDAAHTQPSSRPNMVFILVDDLRWDGLSSTGHSYSKTPQIDRVAKEGALFKNFFVTIPLCSPSRACLLTGQYSHRNGIRDNREHNTQSHKLVTFPRLLHDAGYETAFVGKWHMGKDDSPRPGFDRWVSFRGQGVYENPEINVDGKRMKTPGYMTDLLNSNAVAFVKKPHEKPFLLYLAHKAVHGPFTPAERHSKLYADAMLPAPASAKEDWSGKPALSRATESLTNASAREKKQAKLAHNKDGSEHLNTARQQLRVLAAVDDGVGALLKALEETKQLDNTIFIFTSDNGYFWGEHGGLGDKRWAYEESIRDPLLIRYPKMLKPGTVLTETVLSIDIAPTLLELGQVSIPKEIQGTSMMPLFKGQTADWRKSALFEYLTDPPILPRVPQWQAARTDRWKYIHYTEETGCDELYDLKNDPNEMKNLINDLSSKAALEEMKAELNRLLKQY